MAAYRLWMSGNLRIVDLDADSMREAIEAAERTGGRVVAGTSRGLRPGIPIPVTW